MVGDVWDAAEPTIEAAQVVRLSAADQQAFAAATLDPPAATAALLRAAASHRALVDSEA